MGHGGARVVACARVSSFLRLGSGRRAGAEAGAAAEAVVAAEVLGWRAWTFGRTRWGGSGVGGGCGRKWTGAAFAPPNVGVCGASVADCRWEGATGGEAVGLDRGVQVT